MKKVETVETVKALFCTGPFLAGACQSREFLLRMKALLNI